MTVLLIQGVFYQMDERVVIVGAEVSYDHDDDYICANEWRWVIECDCWCETDNSDDDYNDVCVFDNDD